MDGRRVINGIPSLRLRRPLAARRGLRQTSSNSSTH